MSNLSVDQLVAAAIAASIIPATVSAKAAGESVEMDIASFHPETLSTIFAYGARRMLQDHVNAAAHSFKTAKAEAEALGETFNGGKPFDAAACVSDRIAAFVSGDLKARASGTSFAFSEEEDETYTLAVSVRMEKGWGDVATAYTLSKGLSTAERKRAVLDAVAAMPEATRNRLSAIVADRIAARNAVKGLAL